MEVEMEKMDIINKLEEIYSIAFEQEENTVNYVARQLEEAHRINNHALIDKWYCIYRFIRDSKNRVLSTYPKINDHKHVRRRMADRISLERV